MGNSNYPPGTWEGDPAAPWNEPRDPWEGRTCGECRMLVRVRGTRGTCVCRMDVDEADWVVDPTRPNAAACEAFEAKEW